MKAGWRIRRLVDGSAIVAARSSRALVPRDADGEIRLMAMIVRCGASLWGAHEIAFSGETRLWTIAGTCAWCIAAWRASAPRDNQTKQDGQEEEPGDEPPAYTDAEIREDAITRLRELIGTRNGVLIPEVLTTWRSAGWLAPEVTGADLQRQFIARGIPVRPSLKVAGTVNAGIHRDDLPPLPQPLPDRATAAAG